MSEPGVDVIHSWPFKFCHGAEESQRFWGTNHALSKAVWRTLGGQSATAHVFRRMELQHEKLESIALLMLTHWLDSEKGRQDSALTTEAAHRDSSYGGKQSSYLKELYINAKWIGKHASNSEASITHLS